MLGGNITFRPEGLTGDLYLLLLMSPGLDVSISGQIFLSMSQ